MKANYGYADASGEYYLTIDTDLCDGCGACVDACPHGVIEVANDDYDEPKAGVPHHVARALAQACPGYHARCSRDERSCHSVCARGALEHTW